MNKTILISLLIAGLLLVSGMEGCVTASQPEEKAKQLADKTAEGSAIIALSQSLAKIKDCTIDEVISVTEGVYAKQGMGEFDPSEEEMAQMESLLESAKKCPQRIEKSASKTSETEYLVSYSFVTPDGCQQSGMGPPDGENFVQVEVNIAEETTNVIKGAFNEDQKKGVQDQIQMMNDMGNCGSLMMMATVSSSPAQVMAPTG